MKNQLALIALIALSSPSFAYGTKAKDAMANAKAEMTKTGDVVDTAVKAGQFNTLATALKAAGLVETLKGAGPFTVFAPTDDAFKKLPAGTLEKLLKPENKAQLAKVLTYHVVPGKVMAANVTAGDVKTVEGSAFKVTTEGGVKVNNATVTKTDVDASNGVIHVIDTVILPPGLKI